MPKRLTSINNLAGNISVHSLGQRVRIDIGPLNIEVPQRSVRLTRDLAPGCPGVEFGMLEVMADSHCRNCGGPVQIALGLNPKQLKRLRNELPYSEYADNRFLSPAERGALCV